MRNKLTTEEFINRASELHNYRYTYKNTIYNNWNEKVIITCPTHGDFLQKPSKHLQKQGCPSCAGNKKYTIESFIKKANEVHKNKYDYSLVNYIGANICVKIKCTFDNYIFEQTPGNHLVGKGCPKCSGRLMDTNSFIEKAKSIHKEKFDYSKVIYINTGTKVIIYCNSCKKEFLQTPRNHLSGQGCPKCILKSQTILFQKLQASLPEELFLWEYSPEWLGRQRIDIFMPKYSIGIEYNGIQHYSINEFFGGANGFENTKERDNLKRQKCKENSCILFEIKYNYDEEDYNNLLLDIKKIIINDKVGLLETIQ